MSNGDIIKVGSISFKILKRDGKRILVYWIESSGIEKTRWIML